MADIKWIKITTDMFDNRKIKHLRKLPEGNSIVLIWVMLLTMAGKCNSGGMIFLTENIPYTPKLLADELGFEENTVRLALDALERLGMVSSDFSIIGWEEHQNVEGMEKIREQNRIRKQKQRERQKLLIEENSHVTSRDSHSTDKNKIRNNKKNNNIYNVEQSTTTYSEIIDFLNLKAGTRYKATSKKTQTCIHARLAEGFTVDDFKTVIDKKCSEWIGTEWQKYIRPETLFGTKFEGYLNAKANVKKNTVVDPGDMDDLDDVWK